MLILMYVWLAVGFLGVEQLYVYLARRCRLFEAQTERSLHTAQTVVRGGGILFYIAALTAVCIDNQCQLYFLLDLTVVALISFLDDLYQLPKRYRLMAQCTAVALLLQQTGLFLDTQWLIIGAFVIGVGMLNMFNFMDGINGMTAFYGLTTAGSLLSWQLVVRPNSPSILLASVSIALIVFSVYNARKQAVCFAGDVGSISLGFIIIYELLQLINQQHTCFPLLVIAVYGVDTTLTIIHRLCARQNIFQAHRLHLFQLVVHQKKYTHLTVAGAYAVLQGIINGLIYAAIDWHPLAQFSLAILILSGLSIVYVAVRKALLHEKRSALSADLID